MLNLKRLDIDIDIGIDNKIVTSVPWLEKERKAIGMRYLEVFYHFHLIYQNSIWFKP